MQSNLNYIGKYIWNCYKQTEERDKTDLSKTFRTKNQQRNNPNYKSFRSTNPKERRINHVTLTPTLSIYKMSIV